VRNLPPDFSAAKLAKLFLEHGDVLSTKYERGTERGAPYGFVRFASKEHASNAVAALHGVKLGGDGAGPATAPLEVSVAMTKAEQTAALEDRRRRRRRRGGTRGEEALWRRGTRSGSRGKPSGTSGSGGGRSEKPPNGGASPFTRQERAQGFRRGEDG